MSNLMFAMFGLSTWEIAMVAVVVLLLFGTRLPSAMRSLGRGLVEFKKGMNDTGIEENQESDSAKT